MTQHVAGQCNMADRLKLFPSRSILSRSIDSNGKRNAALLISNEEISFNVI